jgi:formylglycine-generating enzyme required for sulfatase activity
MQTLISPNRACLFALATTIAVSGWSPLWAADERGKVALLVGINNYNRRKLEDRPLRFAERDVQELASVLREQSFAVRVLTGPEATKEHIDGALTELLKGPKKQVVLVAFAGHGTQMPLKDDEGKAVVDPQGRELSDAFFCPFDAVVGNGATMISLTRLVERLDNEGGTNLFLVDACRDDPDPHRGLGKRSLSGDELVGRLPGNSAILFSCSKGQQALEHEQAAGGHGVFFAQVIEGLRGGAADAETGEVGWDDLVGYVRKRVNRLARELDPEGAKLADDRFAGNLQTPQQITNLVATPILARRIKPSLPDAITTRTAGIRLKLIPAGTFQTGSPDGTGEDEEHPQHEVRITRPFYLGVTEVTQAQYQAVIGNNPSFFAASGGGKERVAGRSTDQHPVEEVSWLDAVKFCNKLSELEGRKPFYETLGETVRVSDWRAKGYRLPTEAEWEYACGGNPANLDEQAWSVHNSGNATHPVGTRATNGLGFHDMLGNVWEWCWDAYDKDYYKRLVRDDPTGPETGGPSYRVYRGGSWYDSARVCRPAFRSWGTSEDRFNILGFRVAASR